MHCDTAVGDSWSPWPHPTWQKQVTQAFCGGGNRGRPWNLLVGRKPEPSSLQTLPPAYLRRGPSRVGGKVQMEEACSQKPMRPGTCGQRSRRSPVVGHSLAPRTPWSFPQGDELSTQQRPRKCISTGLGKSGLPRRGLPCSHAALPILDRPSIPWQMLPTGALQSQCPWVP